MDIGLSKEQVAEILRKEIANGKVSSAEGLVEVISRAIDENNKAIESKIGIFLGEQVRLAMRGSH